MTISTYQIRSVLRIYGNQLKRRGRLYGEGMESTRPFSEFVDISVEARKRQVVNQLSHKLVTGLRTAGDQEEMKGESVRPFEEGGK